MKCDKCGYPVNPGDQICLNCGAKLNFNNAIMPGIDRIETEEKKSSKKYFLLIILGIILVIAIALYFVLGK